MMGRAMKIVKVYTSEHWWSSVGQDWHAAFIFVLIVMEHIHLYDTMQQPFRVLQIFRFKKSHLSKQLILQIQLPPLNKG